MLVAPNLPPLSPAAHQSSTSHATAEYSLPFKYCYMHIFPSVEISWSVWFSGADCHFCIFLQLGTDVIWGVLRLKF
jgi:hypothetical protein